MGSPFEQEAILGPAAVKEECLPRWYELEAGAGPRMQVEEGGGGGATAEDAAVMALVSRRRL